MKKGNWDINSLKKQQYKMRHEQLRIVPLKKHMTLMHCYVSHSGVEIGWKIMLRISSHPFRRVANLALTPLLLR